LPGGKRTIDGAVLPLNHPVCLGDPEDPSLHGHERAISLPPLQPPMGRTLGCPLAATWAIALATAGEQHLEQGIDDLAKGGTGHPPAPP